MEWVGSVFVLILFLDLNRQGVRRVLSTRTREEWGIDLLGLIFQGVGVPLLQTGVLLVFLFWVFPQWKGILQIGFLKSFLLNFVVIDYLYYWNHRLFHSDQFWWVHRLHHTSTHLDLFATSRNLLWTPFFLVYLWMNSLFLFFISDPSGYLLGAAVTAALDLWRHSGYDFGNLPWERKIAMILITPREHAWHHHSGVAQVNFGANLTFWDRLHGTYFRSSAYPERVGPKAFEFKERLKWTSVLR